MKISIRLLILTFILCFGKTVIAQRLNVPNLVNSIYKNLNGAKVADTLFFLNDCNPELFKVENNKTLPIIVTSLNANDTLDSAGPLLKISILAVGANKMTLKTGIYRPTKLPYIRGKSLLEFIDERTIICILSKNGWQYSKTIKIDDH